MLNFKSAVNKREDFAVSLRKEKKKKILDRRREILGSKGKKIL